MPRAKKVAEFDPDYVRDISVQVYKQRLEASSSPPGAVERMIAKDGDKGQKLRERAGGYDSMTRSYLKVLKP